MCCSVKKSQKGATLVAALIFIMVITMTSVALMQVTSLEIKTTAAQNEYVEAVDVVLGAIDEVVYKGVNKKMTGISGVDDYQNFFTRRFANETSLTVSSHDNVDASIREKVTRPTNCPREEFASSNVFECMIYEVEAQYDYASSSSVNAVSGISQQLFVEN